MKPRGTNFWSHLSEFVGPTIQHYWDPYVGNNLVPLVWILWIPPVRILWVQLVIIFCGSHQSAPCRSHMTYIHVTAVGPMLSEAKWDPHVRPRMLFLDQSETSQDLDIDESCNFSWQTCLSTMNLWCWRICRSSPSNIWRWRKNAYRHPRYFMTELPWRTPWRSNFVTAK